MHKVNILDIFVHMTVQADLLLIVTTCDINLSSAVPLNMFVYVLIAHY